MTCFLFFVSEIIDCVLAMNTVYAYAEGCTDLVLSVTDILLKCTQQMADGYVGRRAVAAG